MSNINAPCSEGAFSFDTIAAISTGSVLSAIGIVRMSGPDSLPILDRVFRPAFGPPMSQQPNRKLVYGTLMDEEGRTLDICMATVSRGPNSYTGEDTAELQCHGSPTVLREALRVLFAAGARQAKAGEFTRRAFVNGRMDLIQAEAVIDLIDSETPQAARTAAQQLNGAVSRRTEDVYQELSSICSHFHAVLDYPDEDIEDFELENYQHTLQSAASQLQALSDSYRRGSVVKNGLLTAIIGRANVGKSSLMNALLGYERAIVTDIAGTTRDTIEEKAVVGNLLLRLTDTAGQRETEDPVEQLGVQRAKNTAASAGLVLAVLDGSVPLTEEDRAVLRQAEEAEHSLVILNKSDLPPAFNYPEGLRLSAATGEGLDLLEERIKDMFPEDKKFTDGEILTSARQAEAAGRALEYLKAADNAMEAGIPPDAVLTEIEGAMTALAELSGRSVREDITNGIFARFCVGK